MEKLGYKIEVVFKLCFLMAFVYFVNVLIGERLLLLGIRPGDPASLPNIFLAPWLHGSWSHLINNLVGFAVFSALCILRGTKFFAQSSFIIITLTGLLVWAFGRTGAIHIGASGWIFGLWSLSMAVAFFHHSFLNVAIAIFVALVYGGMIWGVLPSNPYISFESHLFGAISGVLAAYFLRPKRGAVNRRR